MKNILTVLLVAAVLVLSVGVASHAARVDVNYLAGTWHRASLLALAAIVAALLLAAGVLSALAADLGSARDRRTLEGELQRTYVRLRAAEGPPSVQTAPLAASLAPPASLAAQTAPLAPPPGADEPTDAS
jgi:uncharacterized integral membrane protein